MKNLGLPTMYQWERIIINTLIYMTASFCTYVTAAGGISPDTAGITLALTALGSAFFAGVKFLITTLFEKSIK